VGWRNSASCIHRCTSRWTSIYVYVGEYLSYLCLRIYSLPCAVPLSLFLDKLKTCCAGVMYDDRFEELRQMICLIPIDFVSSLNYHHLHKTFVAFNVVPHNLDLPPSLISSPNTCLKLSLNTLANSTPSSSSSSSLAPRPNIRQLFNMPTSTFPLLATSFLPS
jgi:hypothetical protein